MRKASYAVIMAGTTFQGLLLFWALSMGAIASPSPETDKLISDLLAAKTESAQKELLEHRSVSLTLEVERGLIAEAERLSRASKHSEALSAYGLVRLVAEQIGDQQGTAFALRNIGDIECAQGRYPLALEAYHKSLKLGEKTGDQEATALAMKSIGSVYVWQGEYREALDYYRETLRLGEETGNKKVIGLAWSGIAVTQYWDRNYPAALESYTKSLEIGEQLNDKTSVARILSSIGLIFNMQGNYLKAVEYYRKSLQLSRELGNKIFEADVLNSMGLVFHYQGNLTQALDLYHRSLRLTQAAGDPRFTASTLNSIGHAYFLQRNYERAMEYYRKVLKLDEGIANKPQISLALKNLGDIYSTKGNFTQARMYYDRSFVIEDQISGDKNTMANLLISNARTYLSEGNSSKALEFANDASRLARQMASSERLWEARNMAGMCHRALGQADSARQAYLEAIDVIERLRNQVVGSEQEEERYFENKVSPYYAMVDLLVSQKNPWEAFNYAERAKARVLLGVLKNGRTNIAQAMTREERDEEHHLDQEIFLLNDQILGHSNHPHSAELHQRLVKARLDYEAFETGLYAAHPEIKLHNTQTSPVTIRDAERLIPEKTAWINYVVMEDKVYFFVLTREKPSANILIRVYYAGITQRELFRHINAFRRCLKERKWNFQTLASQLYTLLIKPAETQLRGTQTLCISPDGILWELPFQALLTRENQYLIDDYAVFFVPSLSVLREMMASRSRKEARGSKESLPGQPRSQGIPTLLAFANPALSPELIRNRQDLNKGANLGSLPEAETEATELGRLYGAAHSKIYTGLAASEHRAKSEMPEYTVLHFATHGFIDDRNPVYSNLLLSKTSDMSADDGLLEARELMSMDLRADLAILSACETACGQVRAGEGIIGMSWAFFLAGCPTTVVSQWRVNSHSTSEFMLEFHRNLIRQKFSISKARALQMAALKLRKGALYEHPFYWAPFIVVGRNDFTF